MYRVSLAGLDGVPVLSYRGVDGSPSTGNSAFQQVFNPSWIVASAKVPHGGLLSRTQNCTAKPGQCVRCAGKGQNASVLTYARLVSGDGANDHPVFLPVSNNSVVFAPHDMTDDLGTEDPRVVFDEASGLYIMLYTCYNSGTTHQPKITMCAATSPNPTRPDQWQRHGPVGLPLYSKSGALLLRGGKRDEHLLYWGAGVIHLSRSRNVTHWPVGEPFITNTSWGNPHVEAGPPPLRLSTGDYIFFHNSWNRDFPAAPGYQPAWVILSGTDPTSIVQRAAKPLWSPQEANWMTGEAPAACNVPNVAFLEAAHPTDEPDTFRVYFGGADAVVGTGVVKVERS